ncbi:alpha/beta-hydrolase [Microthyrium microscopicum]|uniref:Alpha/beta-hydrolase n=1 Tax=Microthyrium microscopicum TaxID=703497 RepID=A0A6A6UQ62_9PEZI|nr:alpha/beta-hydrolase [Microthyrium microscopicum]
MEPRSPYGIVVGDPLFDALQKKDPKVTGYAVNYPASFALDSKVKGAADVVAHLESQSKTCPDQKYVLVGYSQGADVMHGASVQLKADMYPRVIGFVLFGDPGNRGPNVRSPLGGTVPPLPKELAEKLMENCAPGDPVCTGSGTKVADHLVYVENPWISDSVAYIQKQLETGGKAGPKPSPNGGEKDKATAANEAALSELGVMLGGTKDQLSALAGKGGKGA